MNNHKFEFSLSDMDNKDTFDKMVKRLCKLIPSEMHPLIAKYDKIIKEREHRRKYEYLEDLPMEYSYEKKRKLKFDDDIRIDEPILDVLVSASQRKKAYKFLNIFFEGIEALSGHISVECFYKGATIIQIGRVTWELKLTEPKLTRRHLDQKDSSPMAPLHQRVSSGMLELELVNKATNGVINYSEQKVSLLQQLPDVFDELRDQYVAIDSKIRAEEKKKAMAAEKKEQEKENKRLKERELQLQVEVDNKNIELKQEIYKHIEEFEKITKVNKYLENIKKSYEDTEYEKIINQYSEQVECVLNLNDFSKKLEDWVERIKFMGND